jgi:hypothetical protein
MQPRNPAVRKCDSPEGEPDRPSRALLSVRSALVLTVALLVGFGAAALLYLAHRPVALIALGAAGFFGGALKLLNSLIELRSFSIRSVLMAMTALRTVEVRAHGRRLGRGRACGPRL